jgi:GntR family transcriptional regulator/MocR family aminotransferase
MRYQTRRRGIMFLDLDGNGPLYSQLSRALKQAILRGRLKAGTRLPATRQLAADLSLSRNTVLTAYELLCAEQLAVASAGSGTFVAEGVGSGPPPFEPVVVPAQSLYAARLRRLPPLALRRADPGVRYDLQYGEPFVDPLLMTAWRRALTRATAGSEWRYPPSAGLPALRQGICD